jgi:hypothetical protein
VRLCACCVFAHASLGGKEKFSAFLGISSCRETDHPMSDSKVYNDLQLSVAAAFSETVSALSALGSVFVLIAYLRYKALRKWSFTLVACLAATDVMNQIFDFFSPSPSEIDAMIAGAPNTGKCWVQALGNGVFELASVFWTGTIAYTLYRLVWLRHSLEVVEKTLPQLCAFVFGVPTLLTLLPFLQGPQVYGPSGGHATWCWIKPAYPWWVFLCFYIPLWMTMIFNAFVHLRTLARLKSIQAGGMAAAEQGGQLDANTAARFQLIVQRLHWYPFLLLVVWGPASINRIIEAATQGRGSFYALYFLQRVFSSSQGLLNAIAYGLTRGVKEAILKDLQPFLPPSWVRRAPQDASGPASGPSSARVLDLELAPPTSGMRGLLHSEVSPAVDARAIGVGLSAEQTAAAVEEDDDAHIAPPSRVDRT